MHFSTNVPSSRNIDSIGCAHSQFNFKLKSAKHSLIKDLGCAQQRTVDLINAEFIKFANHVKIIKEKSDERII